MSNNTKTEYITFVMYGLLLFVVGLMSLSLLFSYFTDQKSAENNPVIEQDADTVNDYYAVPKIKVQNISKAETRANDIGWTFDNGYRLSVTEQTNQTNN